VQSKISNVKPLSVIIFCRGEPLASCSGLTYNESSTEREAIPMEINQRLSKEHEKLLMEQICLINETSRFPESMQYIQHGTTSVYQHSLSVAYLSCLLAEIWNLQVDWTSMIRGAILHDYFLYDWHVKDPSHRLHGFYHASKALKISS
jgi:hypothetical protein